MFLANISSFFSLDNVQRDVDWDDPWNWTNKEIERMHCTIDIEPVQRMYDGTAPTPDTTHLIGSHLQY